MTLTFSFVHPEQEAYRRAWTDRLAPENPECSLDYIEALITCEPDKQHHHVLGQDEEGTVVAVAYFSIQTVEFVLGSKVKVLTLGGSLSANAIWVDASRTSYKSTLAEMLQFCSKSLKYHVILLKPFEATQSATALRHHEEDLGFINVYASTQADVDLSALGSYEEYVATLEKKKRYYLRKIEKDAGLAGLQVQLTSDFAAVVPEIYPLYRSVIARASEVKDNDPLPPKYLECLSRLSTLNSKAVLARSEGRIVGFLVLLEKNSVLWCGPCGMDHESVKRFNTWYVLIHEAIKYGIRARSRTVILGTTNFSMKKKFGARRMELWISLRFRSRLLTQLSAPFVRFWLRKNVFSGDPSDAPLEEVAHAG